VKQFTNDEEITPENILCGSAKLVWHEQLIPVVVNSLLVCAW
jgi:hypothetical protein